MLAERFGSPRAIGVARRATGLLERVRPHERLRSAVEPLAACGARVEQARALIDPARRYAAPDADRGARHAARGARARRRHRRALADRA